MYNEITIINLDEKNMYSLFLHSAKIEAIGKKSSRDLLASKH